MFTIQFHPKVNSKMASEGNFKLTFPILFFSIFFLSRLIFLLFIKRKKKVPGLFYMLFASALKLAISPKFLVPLIGECILKSKIRLLAVFTPIDWVCT